MVENSSKALEDALNAYERRWGVLSGGGRRQLEYLITAYLSALPFPSPVLADEGVDKARLDWLEMQSVEVRHPLLYGSRFMFAVAPIEGFENEYGPSELRAKIDRAIASTPPVTP